MENAYLWSIITFDAVLMFIHGFLYLVERKKYILLWCCSWLLFMISYALSVLKLSTEYFLILGLAETLAGFLAFWAVAAGSIRFFRGSASKAISKSTLAVCAYIVIAFILRLPDNFVFIPRFVLGGLLLIYAGIVSMKTPYIKSITRYILGAFFVLWGISNFIFVLEYLSPGELYYASLILLQVVPMAATISLQMVYFQHSREKQLIMDSKMYKLITYDSLTGLYNRGYCEIEIQKTDSEENLPISIIMGDLNGLKLINDTFGHRKGDELLVKISDIMKEAASDHIVGRWGGDEFIIILAKTPLNKALDIIHNIKCKCAENKDGNIPLDISLGAATKSKKEQSMDETIGAADIMLYKNKLAESKYIKKSIVEYLKNVLMEKNIETEEHIVRMREMSYVIAHDMKLSSKEQEDLAAAAFLHDIGKISVPESILKKPGKLTSEEWDIIKKHPEFGYRITLASEEFAHVSRAVLYHHERWDGKGYPQGLKGKDIPLEARIISVIDAFDAMTHPRVYNNNSISTEDALAEIERCAGTQFDPSISERFVKIIRKSCSKDFGLANSNKSVQASKKLPCICNL